MRSIGQLSPLLGSFFAVVAPLVIDSLLHVLPLRLSRCSLGPAHLFHRGPFGRGDGAVHVSEAEPLPAGWEAALPAVMPGPSSSCWTAPSWSTVSGQVAALVTILSLYPTVLFHFPATNGGLADHQPTRAAAMTLHNHGGNGRSTFTAWARATCPQEGGGGLGARGQETSSGRGARAASECRKGNGRQEAVGAAEVFVWTSYAAAPTASMQRTAGGSKVGVADSTSRAGSAATPTLRNVAAAAMPGAEVGVPEFVLATGFARTPTRPEALADRDWCFVDMLLPPR